MQSISVLTSQNVRINYKIASVGDRIAATIIDGLIIFAYLFMMVMLLDSIDFTIQWAYIILFLPYPFYHLMMEIFMEGQSIGKKAMNIKVISMDGSRPSIGMYFIRWIMRLIDMALFSGLVAVITVVASGKGQRLGDMLAGTTVIKLSIAAASTHEVNHTFKEDHEVIYPEAVRLSDSDITLIDQAIAFNKSEGNPGPANLLAEKLCGKMGIRLTEPPLKFLYDVKKDYYHLTSIN